MSVAAKTQTLYDSLVQLVSQQSECCSVVSLQTVQASSEIVQLAQGVLIAGNGGLIPTASGLLKRKGCDLITIKRSDEPGNAMVFVEIDAVRVCIYAAPNFLGTINEALGVDAPQVNEPTGYFGKLMKKLFG